MEANMREKIQDALGEHYACYVLVTCQEPQDNGNMIVEMNWAGDPDLAQMLLQDAYEKIDIEVDEERFDSADYLEFLEENDDDTSPHSFRVSNDN